jgi:hypothetical protein
VKGTASPRQLNMVRTTLQSPKLLEATVEKG